MSERIKSAVSHFHEYDIYYPRRSINIFGAIDHDMFVSVFKNLHALDNTQGTINIFINSEGGCFTSGRAIFDSINGCKNYVRAMVYGEASSMASVILQAADERIMAPGSYIMIHDGEEYLGGHPENIKRWDNFYKIQREWFYRVYLEKIKIVKPRFTKKKLQDLLKFDTILYADDAIKLGLADKKFGCVGE